MLFQLISSNTDKKVFAEFLSAPKSFGQSQFLHARAELPWSVSANDIISFNVQDSKLVSLYK